MFTGQRFILKKHEPDSLVRASEQAAVAAFHRARRKFPAYAKFLKESGVRASAVKTFKNFESEVPIVDKKILYSTFQFSELFPDILLSPSGRLWTSSGSSGSFSLGFEKPVKKGLDLDFLLDYLFGITQRKTLLLNCLPTLWPLHLRFAHVADVGTRTDVAAALIKKTSNIYECCIIGGEPLFLKKAVEDLAKAEIDFTKREIHLISGGDFTPEGLRRYLASCIGTTPTNSNRKRQNSVFCTMGLSEFGVGLFFELPCLSSMRTLLSSNPDLLGSLLGGEATYCPQIFQYNPGSTCVETPLFANGHRRIVLTTLSADPPAPFIRYDTGDLGQKTPLREFLSFAAKHAPHISFEALFPFPIVFGAGKATDLSHHNRSLKDLNELKTLLFSFESLLPNITGCFWLTANPDATVQLQLKDGVSESQVESSILGEMRHVFKSKGLNLQILTYRDFPMSVELSFERKFTCVHPSFYKL